MKTKYILAIETSTEHLGVALCTTDGHEISSYNDLAYRRLSDDLHIAIDKVMTQAKTGYDLLEFIAVTRGPGSFTSIRLGISAAKGLAFTQKLPIVSLTSLETLAWQYMQGTSIDASKGTLCVWIEAHGGNIYVQNFNAQGSLASPVSMKACDAGSLLKAGDILIGNGVINHREDIPEGVHCPEGYAYINPSQLAKLAQRRYSDKTDDVNNTTALYVHPLNYNKTYNKDGSKK
ncbi:MAG: tRNA threonylcarbamoyladenosine biosynthesis protein TsaB [Alphaproteobacteria bacterium]|jgi:tRNA threonylcarbamoyladenosine biosynthesis protein TsaB